MANESRLAGPGGDMDQAQLGSQDYSQDQHNGSIPGLDNGATTGDGQLQYNAYDALLNLMRRLYPENQNYKDGLLLGTYVSVDTTPQAVAEVPINAAGAYEIQTNSSTNEYNDQGWVRIKKTQIRNIVPADGDLVDELIDDTFSFFEDEPFEDLPDPPEIENDIFLSLESHELVDPHNAYLQRGPSNGIYPPQSANGTYCVFYIQQGLARPIPNYQTLEVMLVERQQEYNSIGLMQPEQAELYKINDQFGPLADSIRYAQHQMPNRQTEWNLEVRLKSGYRPVIPFVRDPADYYTPDTPDENGNPYDPIVYSEQTAKEQLREKYEGKMVAFNVTYRGANDEGKLETDIIGADINSVRIMTFGFWKWPLELETYRAYNEYLDIGAQPPGENFHINWLDRFNKAGFLTSFQGGDGGQFISGWNDFPHIAGADTLDVNEYTDYYDTTGGDIFTNEYLEPYEPPGSLKYYTGGASIISGPITQLQIEALASLEALEDQVAAQQSLFQSRDIALEELKGLKSAAETAKANIGSLNEFNQLDYVASIRTQASALRDDLCDIIHPQGGTGKWKLFKKSKKKGEKRGFFRLIENEMANSHEKACIDAYLKSHEETNVILPADFSTGTDTTRLLKGNNMTEISDINAALREIGETLGELISDLFVDGLFSNTFPAMGTGGPPGVSPGMVGEQIKQGIKQFFENIGNRIDNFLDSFGRYNITSFYTDRYRIRQQISTYAYGETWGDNSAKTVVMNDQEKIDADFSYYDSPIYGEMTSFDESIENILGSETYASNYSDMSSILNEIISDANQQIQILEDIGFAVNPSQVATAMEVHEVNTNRFRDEYAAIELPTLETVQHQFDIVAKRWVGKAHNTINFIREKYYNKFNKKYTIKYNPKAQEIVKKYYPNAGAVFFNDEDYRLLNVQNIY